MSNKKIRVAVIGVGGQGTRVHIPAYLHNKDVDLVALVDVDETKVKKDAKKFGIKKYFSSFDELLQNQNIEAASICTPPNTHAEIALKALANDIHVLCEKPMATNTDDARKMYEASVKKEKILMIGFNLRFQPNYERASDLVLRGRVGHVYLVECNILSSNPLLTWSKSPWFFNAESGGGVLVDKGPHVFDLINYIFSDFPIAVSALSSTYFSSSVEDSCICALEYPGPRIGIGKMSWLSSQYIESLSIYGTAQSVFASPYLFVESNATDIPQVSLWRKATESLIRLKFPNFPSLRGTKMTDSYQLEIDHFIKSIRNKQNYSPTALSGLNVLITCDAARKSIETGRKIGITPAKELTH
jgi:UDP-N-acetylglucosamine 3-dehydrogenase